MHDIQPLSSDCPVSTEADVRTIDDVSTIESIAWFRRLLDEGAAMADDAIMALSFHPEDQALPVLIEILEDRGQRQYNREQALFWMVQSDSDAAYAYLDRMLD